MALCLLLAFGLHAEGLPAYAKASAGKPVVGAERLGIYLPLLKDKQIGLVVNPSSRIGTTHLVDSLSSLGVCILRIFALEHGFRGQEEAGEKVADSQDTRTGIPILSLYGRKKRPSSEDLAGLDVVVFDIQDVGARFFTYISSLYYIMEACAENGVPLIVLDRPNPNGHYVDGPILDMRLESFIGALPLPIVHGCTVGELALLIKGEYWMKDAGKLDLTVIPCTAYGHKTAYSLPVRPSPNLPDDRSILLYPSICLFEGTSISLGRGTDTPFQLLGHPDMPCDTFWFVPRPTQAAKNPPLQGLTCWGANLRHIPIACLRARTQLDLYWLLEFYRAFPDKSAFFLPNGFFELLAGTYSLRKQIEAGKSEAEIRATWQEDLDFFKEIRLKYLLYPE